jgi:hypothetical protein
MTLHFRPLPPACEPACIRKVRETLRNSWTHPDTDEIDKVLDVLAHALLRVEELSATVSDAAVREALVGPHSGLVGCMRDTLSDVSFALDCWVSDPWNEPGWMAQCDAADAEIDRMKEARP